MSRKSSRNAYLKPAVRGSSSLKLVIPRMRLPPHTVIYRVLWHGVGVLVATPQKLSWHAYCTARRYSHQAYGPVKPYHHTKTGHTTINLGPISRSFSPGKAEYIYGRAGFMRIIMFWQDART